MNTLEKYSQHAKDKNAYQYITWLNDLGHSVKLQNPRTVRNYHNFIRRCETNTWIGYDGHKLACDSNSNIHKGMGYILVDICNNLTEEQIDNLQLADFKEIILPLPAANKKSFQLMLNHTKSIVKTVDCVR